ncbi:hypothetical protein EOPP23_12435 [Endozoicomonas sp. OPT23]|uniref:response regulator n=1 Tax=Endozoicomonas sp. OPT23 TaxID=2072845 RepID=UPI00129B3C5C|nr:response regulator [Endozoicomonas sp. OPT23]MRI33793.1 hypothetical protein [Endozoicomonas sp. OPT23]
MAINEVVYLLEQDNETKETIRGLCDEQSLHLKVFNQHNELMSAVQDQTPGCIVAASQEQSENVVELVKHISENNTGVPIVVLGNHNDLNTAVAVIKLGAADYIEKPVISGRLAEHFSQLSQQS